MLKHSISINQEQRLEQNLSGRQLQSLEILQSPIQELQHRLAAELAANPVLEAEAPELEIQIGDPLSSSPEPDFNSADDDDGGIELLAQTADRWHEDLPLPTDAGGDQKARDHFFNSLSSEKSLSDQLLEELALCRADPKIRAVAVMVIGSIDDSGYLRTPAADLAMACGVSLAEAETAIALVQSFDPPGIGARNLAECLRLQLERSGESDPVIFKLVECCLDDIGRNKLPLAAGKLNLSLPELERRLEKLRKLNPYPGTVLSPVAPAYVVPEVTIFRDEEGRYQLEPATRMMKLHIPERYLKMLEDPVVPAADRAYVREKVAAARELIRALEQRESTIRRIARVIIERQKGFLDCGVSALKPMTMRQAAEELSLHETTVSRAVAGKYVETPQGMFEFKYFFSGGYTAPDGAAVSSRSVQEKIRQLVEAENPARPLSDEKIAGLLRRDGLAVARRTVAKYREGIGIPATHLRRRHR